MESFRQTRCALAAGAALLLAPGCPKTDQPVEAAAAQAEVVHPMADAISASFAENNPGLRAENADVYTSADEEFGRVLYTLNHSGQFSTVFMDDEVAYAAHIDAAGRHYICACGANGGVLGCMAR